MARRLENMLLPKKRKKNKMLICTQNNFPSFHVFPLMVFPLKWCSKGDKGVVRQTQPTKDTPGHIEKVALKSPTVSFLKRCTVWGWTQTNAKLQNKFEKRNTKKEATFDSGSVESELFFVLETPFGMGWCFLGSFFSPPDRNFSVRAWHRRSQRGHPLCHDLWLVNLPRPNVLHFPPRNKGVIA